MKHLLDCFRLNSLEEEDFFRKNFICRERRGLGIHVVGESTSLFLSNFYSTSISYKQGGILYIEEDSR